MNPTFLKPKGEQEKRTVRRYLVLSLLMVGLHLFFMLCRYGQLPIAPVVGDEIIINDASVALSEGQGYIATSFARSKYGLDHLFAHFPPVYPYTESVAFRVFGVSSQSLRATATLMSVGSTVVLFLLLLRLCRAGLLDWDVAVLLNALYCTNATLFSLERVARMESMIGLLTFLSLAAIFYALTQKQTERMWAALLAAGVLGALGVAVHPEAVTAVLLLGALMVVLVPARLPVRVAAVCLFALVPLLIGLMIYGTQLLPAVQQFLKIAHDSNLTEPSSKQWLLDALHNRKISTVNRNVFLVLIMGLLALAPVTYAVVIRRLPRATLRYRLGACMAVVSVIEILLMVFLFRMDDRRCQFLFGPLLVLTALCVLGAAPLRRWQRWLGWAVVVAQCCVGVFYLSGAGHPARDLDPNRYMALIKSLPPGASVAATPGLWLDFREAHRPFTLIYYGLDGLTVGPDGKNPLDRFDVILLEDYYAFDKPWWAEEAQPGRVKRTYTIGTDVIQVYSRK
jgi:4-amino-4-deoxy-L-arabinose transferase-like glycosyltransferase